MRKHKEVLADWAGDLARKFGRTEEDILMKGLSLDDFPYGSRVRVNFGEGSTAEFQLAFACINPKIERVAIFTEHCGYHEFPLFEGMEIIEIATVSHYRHE